MSYYFVQIGQLKKAQIKNKHGLNLNKHTHFFNVGTARGVHLFGTV